MIKNLILLVVGVVMDNLGVCTAGRGLVYLGLQKFRPWEDILLDLQN